MDTKISNHRISSQVRQFLLDKKVQGLKPTSLAFYKEKLNKFADFCDEHGLQDTAELSATALRAYISWLEEHGHSRGGIHAHYRSLKAFVRWWELETEPAGWRDPFKRVKYSNNNAPLLEPADLDVVQAILDTCENDFMGLRDRAMITMLADTGCRAREYLQIRLEDVDFGSGAVQILNGKRDKGRTVFVGKKTRRLLRRYLKVRGDEPGYLWLTVHGDRLKYAGLRQVLRRRAEMVGLREPSLHSFRRLFAISMLRNGADVYTLQKLMGHESLTVLRRYLKQTQDDIMEGHMRYGPVDNSDDW